MFILARARGFSGCLLRAARFQSPQRPSCRIPTEDIFHLTRVTRIFQKSVFTKTTCGSLFRCGRVFDGASARNDCPAPPLRRLRRRASSTRFGTYPPYAGRVLIRSRFANQAPLLRAWNLRPQRMLVPSRASDGPKENQTEAANQIPETLGSSRPRFCYYVGCIDCFYDDRWGQRLAVWEFG
jgi:hypothetical protein